MELKHPAALYVHVPFCRSKCGYCDFFSLPSPEPGDMQAYPRQALGELDRFVDRYRDGAYGVGSEREWDGRFDTVYVGGGTPSLLPIQAMDALLSGLRPYLGGLGGRRGEWTVECNPESLNAGLLGLFLERGVTRISLGVQSFEAEALEAAGRPGSLDETEAAVDLLSSVWKGEWNADLIAGLPGQSREGPKRDVKRLHRSGASHISLYSLTIEEGTPFWSKAAEGNRQTDPGAKRLPGEEEAEDMWFSAAAELAENGFRRYEVSNFCMPGKECRHNLHYWNVDPYIGIGPGAVSTLLLPDGKSLRRSVRKDLRAYLSSAEFECPADYETLDARDSLKDYLLMSLRTDRGALNEILNGRFGIAAEAIAGALPREYRDAEGLAVDPDGMRLEARGLDRLNPLLIGLFGAVDRLMPR